MPKRKRFNLEDQPEVIKKIADLIIDTVKNKEVVSYICRDGQTISEKKVRIQVKIPENDDTKTTIVIDHSSVCVVENDVRTYISTTKTYTYESYSVSLDCVAKYLNENGYNCSYDTYYKSDYGENTPSNPPVYHFKFVV